MKVWSWGVVLPWLLLRYQSSQLEVIDTQHELIIWYRNFQHDYWCWFIFVLCWLKAAQNRVCFVQNDFILQLLFWVKLCLHACFCEFNHGSHWELHINYREEFGSRYLHWWSKLGNHHWIICNSNFSSIYCRYELISLW